MPTIADRKILREKIHFFLFPEIPTVLQKQREAFFILFRGLNRRDIKAGVEVDVVLNGSVVNYKHRHFITCTDTSFQTCSMHEDKSILKDGIEDRPVTL